MEQCLFLYHIASLVKSVKYSFSYQTTTWNYDNFLRATVYMYTDTCIAPIPRLQVTHWKVIHIVCAWSKMVTSRHNATWGIVDDTEELGTHCYKCEAHNEVCNQTLSSWMNCYRTSASQSFQNRSGNATTPGPCELTHHHLGGFLGPLGCWWFLNKISH